jgi:hypothetical protein
VHRSGLEFAGLFFGGDYCFSVVVHVYEEYVFGFLHCFEGDVCCFEVLGGARRK